MRGYGLLTLISFVLFLSGPSLWAQQTGEASSSRREAENQARQDMALRQARQDLKNSSFKGSVRKQVRLGHAAFSQEQYALALDRYLRAYEQEKDSANQMAITFLLGQCQQRLNHPKAASQYYMKLWEAGQRNTGFLKAYLDVLFSLGDYQGASGVLAELERQGQESDLLKVRKESLEKMPEAVEMQQAFGLFPDDVVYDSLLNTAFSEYGPSLVLDRLYFSSSRPQSGQVLSDPRTGQGYSRLFSAQYDPVRRVWADPRPVEGEVAGLEGNVGTFSYDSVRNTGYFTWAQGKNTGIYTVQRQADGSWANRQMLTFNYKSGGDDFVGKVAHPSISRDGKRLLFVYRDPTRGGGTDIWCVERTESKPAPVKKRRTSSSRSRKKTVEPGQTIQVNSEWGLPYRFSDHVNTPGRESFPQWVNDTMFVFASDGHVGNGGMDLYLAVLDAENPSQVSSVCTFPRPINSSYDDNSLLPDPVHGFMLLGSNRYTSWGKTDNLYHIRKSALKHEVRGGVYGKIASGQDSDSADSVSSAGEKVRVKDFYVMVTNMQGGFYQSVSADSNGLFTISYLEPGTYDFTVYADGYRDEKRSLYLPADQVMLPVLLRHRLDFTVELKQERPDPVPVAETEKEEREQDFQKPLLVESTDTFFESDEQKEGTESLIMPRQIIRQLDSMDRFVSRIDQRYVSDYKSRINDPLRRARLTVVPPTAKCEVCGEEGQWRKNVGEEFYVKSGDDKALITLVDGQGNTTYVDLAPNSAYSIQVQTLASDGPGLPSGIRQDDIVRKVATRDYVLFECMPKLSEINDEVYVNNVYFDFDKAELIKDGPRELDRMIIVAIKNPQMYFQIESHADERGSEEYNRRLTDRRLAAVEEYVERKGMDMSRVEGRSMGESDPLIANARTEEEHRLNRRTTFTLVNPQARNVKKGDASYPAPEAAPRIESRVGFMVQIGAFRQPLEDPLSYYRDVVENNPDLKITYYMDKDGLYKYNVGGYFEDIGQARSLVERLLKQKRECYISAFYKGRRITVSEALKIKAHTEETRISDR